MALGIGQLVECIDATFRAEDARWCAHLPTLGGRYTIRDIEPGHRGLGVRLVEIVNPPIPVLFRGDGIRKMEPLWLANRFRPITDISIFLEMTKRATQGELV